MNRKICFIGPCLSPKLLERFIKKHAISDVSANVLAWKIIRGVATNGFDVKAINEMKINRPSMSHIIFLRAFSFSCDKIEVDTVPFINQKVIYHLIKHRLIIRKMTGKRFDTIIVYSLHAPYLKAAINYSKKTDARVLCVVPDLSENMFGNYRGIRKVLKRVDSKRINKLVRAVDAFILLTKDMRCKIPTAVEKPCLIIEGVADESNPNKEIIRDVDRADYILYSGSISKEYGIEKLIKSYLSTSIKSELWFCGQGNYVDKLKEACKKNESIKYLGIKSRNEVIQLQRNASLLVNPRDGSDEYTRYSFPSKTIEYLASGTPLMMERLRGIPDEYYEHIIDAKGDWKKALSDFFSLPRNERIEIGNAGREFIVRNKSVYVQGRRLAEFILELSNDTKTPH